MFSGSKVKHLVSRIQWFTYVRLNYDYQTGELVEAERRRFSWASWEDLCVTGADDDVREGVAIMHREVDVSITWVTQPTPCFQHLFAGIYKAGDVLAKVYLASPVASGGVPVEHCTQITWQQFVLRHDRYHGRRYADAQFAGSFFLFRLVAMMGFIGMITAMVGATVALAVAVSESQNAANDALSASCSIHR
ncbi:GGGtGRT protein [Vibrio lentus]|nr:GGGtGRT protein [Vibrio lentus]